MLALFAATTCICGSAIAGLAQTPTDTSWPEYVGAARMFPDGTIALRLISHMDGLIAHAYVLVKPTDPDYAEIWTHLGGINRGEEKLIPAWPPQATSEE
jgi:hypothetical protein